MIGVSGHLMFGVMKLPQNRQNRAGRHVGERAKVSEPHFEFP
jgi:hypothetical protein